MNIVLIPKKSKPESMSDLRPIALCNVAYKIVSKVLANQLKVVLPSVISETQSAFLPGRLITDNILISFEMMHYLKRKQMGRDGFMALKLDMSKAYDRVEWGFLQAMLRRLGFDKHVGDPLSPYLFLLCTEVFSALIRDYERLGKIRRCKVARGAPVLSHMFFVDDCYVFCKASEDSAINMIEILYTFQKASGQQVNIQKSSIFFSANIVNEVRQHLCFMLGVNEAGDDSTYLGLPNIVGRNKTALLGFLKDKMRKKIQGWEERLLSRARKELLIKIVAQSLPSYAMNVFLLPVETSNEMEQLMCKFWWRSSKNNKGIHWKKLFSHPDSLVSKIFKARYYRNGTFLNAELGSNPNFVWRSIYETQEIVRKGTRCRVGDGSRINLVLDPWLPNEDNPRVTSNNPALIDQNVKALMETDTLAWDVDLVHDTFNERDANLILSISLSSSRLCDVWYWSLESSGHFSVKSVYKFLQLSKELGAHDDNSVFWNTLWKLSVPPKVKDLLWRAATNWPALTVASVAHLAQALLPDWTRAQDSTFNPTAAFLTDVDGAETWAKPAENTLGVATRNGGSLGIKEALSWVKQKDLRKVVIETDSLTVVQALRSSIPMVSHFGSIISDCKMLLNDLRDVYINFIRRSANNVAHFLARVSYLVADRIIRVVMLLQILIM
ncbi:uncharacterized protein LOC133031536 [Cannabis sativa]|uniref:uncharacterized protein LOC133031536 n=1 Tax=Cannabis sativa TaxID=3483 RepID=UPI0029CA8799|nr:uncharacterized protein LOC133031536 [Cannabis sativa]